jgi:hypothetical protein
MAAVALAAGVLGVGGWGIYRRSLVVSKEADALPLPAELENNNRAWVATTIAAGLGPGNPFEGFDELSGFITETGWDTGNRSLTPGQESKVAEIKGALWPYTRLIQATSLNLMCLVNSAHARSQSPPIPDREIGGPKSLFNLERTTPLLPPPPTPKGSGLSPLSQAEQTIQTYLRTKIPVPNQPPPPPKSGSSVQVRGVRPYY